MKRILTTLSHKWPEYLLEILVITVGILGAFALNNWNDQRLDSIEEQEILRNLRADFLGSIEEFEALNSNRSKLFSANLAIDQISMNGIQGFSEANLDSLIAMLHYQPTYNSKGSALEVLTNSGKINLIRNSEIRNRLISWPGLIADMQEGEVNDTRLANERFFPILDKYVPMAKTISRFQSPQTLFRQKKYQRPDNRVHFESNYEKLFQDRMFLNLLDRRIFMNMIAFNETKILIDEATEIINLIDEELTK